MARSALRKRSRCLTTLALASLLATFSCPWPSLSALLVPFGRKDGLSLGLAARGAMIQETYDAAGSLQARQSSPFALTFAMRRATGARWLNVAVLPANPGG